ncbi:MAG: ATP-binding protein [Bacteroidota bacterium]
MNLRKIAIVGPESTGKSLLSQQLADHFQTAWVEEYAREFLNQLGREYQQADLIDIAKGQLALEEERAIEANSFLFCDTNLLVIKVWSEFVFGGVDPWLLENMKLGTYDLHLLTDIDLPWEEDPLREHPYRRKELFDIYRKELLSAGVPFEIVSGKGPDRITSALKALEAHSLVPA